MSGFLHAVGVVFESEGGFADVPEDRGGKTKYGITERVWRKWVQVKGLNPKPVREMHPDEAQQIYFEWYWLAGHCELLRWPCSLLHFDARVQHPPRDADRMLQRALNVADDGIVGPKTRAAIDAAEAAILARDMLIERCFYYWGIFLHPERGHRQLRTFGRGWRHRISELDDLVDEDYMRSLIDSSRSAA